MMCTSKFFGTFSDEEIQQEKDFRARMAANTAKTDLRRPED